MSSDKPAENQPLKPRDKKFPSLKASRPAEPAQTAQKPTSALQRGAQAALCEDVDLHTFENVDFRGETDDSDYEILHNTIETHSAYPGQADHPRKYPQLSEQEKEDEEYAEAKEALSSGERVEPFVVLSPKRDEKGRDKRKPSARVGSADRADKYL